MGQDPKQSLNLDPWTFQIIGVKVVTSFETKLGFQHQVHTWVHSVFPLHSTGHLPAPGRSLMYLSTSLITSLLALKDSTSWFGFSLVTSSTGLRVPLLWTGSTLDFLRWLMPRKPKGLFPRDHGCQCAPLDRSAAGNQYNAVLCPDSSNQSRVLDIDLETASTKPSYISMVWNGIVWNGIIWSHLHHTWCLRPWFQICNGQNCFVEMHIPRLSGCKST